MSENNIVPSLVEALILASPEPLAGRKVAAMRDDLTPGKVAQAVADLNNRYMETGSSFRIREIAGGYQFYILPEFSGYVDDLFTRRRKMRLTKPALETLAVVAYRQPVTKAQIEHVRGVASDGVIHNLLEKKMITMTGRADTVGRPLQYGTADEFLKFFGLATLADLPKMSEIEELIKAAEPENHQQLTFAADALDQQMQQKLNVADGTFDPASRDDDVDEPIEASLEKESLPKDSNQDAVDVDDEPSAPEKVDEEMDAVDAKESVGEFEQSDRTADNTLTPVAQETVTTDS